MVEVTKMSTKGQLIIPIRIREKLGLEPGDCFQVDEESGAIILTKLEEEKAKPGTEIGNASTKEVVSKSSIKRIIATKGEDWRYCHECQIKRGGKVPKWGHNGITVTKGKCGICCEEKTLIPNNDYNWPGKSAWID